MTFPAFKRFKAPKMQTTRTDSAKDLFRGSARERGYTGEWDALRNAYIERHPFCEECRRRGYLFSAEVVDHMMPVRDRPDSRLDAENLDSLCNDHHNGWKRSLERYARATGQIDLLPTWVKQPDLRPSAFMIQVTGPVQPDGSLA